MYCKCSIPEISCATSDQLEVALGKQNWQTCGPEWKTLLSTEIKTNANELVLFANFFLNLLIKNNNVFEKLVDISTYIKAFLRKRGEKVVAVVALNHVKML